MPVIKYIEADGREYEIDVPVGQTLMEGAVDNMIEGIVAECGGACSCATCHCYIDENAMDILDEADNIEKEMLLTVPGPRRNSRLSCQIVVTDELDGLVVNLPVSQY